jgi:hypothetical protein
MPATATPPVPSAPAAPAAPSLAPTPVPAPAGAPAPGKSLSAAFDDLDTALANDAPAGGDAPTEGDEPVAPSEGGKPAKATPAAPAKPATAVVPAKPGAPTPTDTPKLLRGLLQVANKERDTLKAEVAALKKVQAEAAARGSTDTGALGEDLARARADLEAKETELRLLRYEKSDDYRTKFEKPYNDGFARAYRDVGELLVEHGGREVVDEATGTKSIVDRQTRPGTKADFNAIYQLPLGEATRKARELFGDSASVVLGWRSKLRDLAEQAASASDEYRTKGAAEEQARTARAAQEREASTRMLSKVSEDLATKYATHFGPDESDPDGNALLERGRSMVEKFFADPSTLSLEDRVILKAQISHRAAAFGRMAARVKARDARIAALEAELAEFKDSTPGKPSKPGGGSAKTPSTTPKLREAMDGIPG